MIRSASTSPRNSTKRFSYSSSEAGSGISGRIEGISCFVQFSSISILQNTKNRLVKQALARAKAEQMQNLEQKRLAVEKEIKADEDFAAYSRKNERDFALCKKSGSEECRKRYPGAFSKPSGHSVTFDLGSESKIKN